MAILEIKTSSTLEEVLKRFEEKGRSVGEFAPTVAEMLVGAVHDVFEAEGPGWEPLTDATIAARRNHKAESIKILRDTGILSGSIEPRYGADFAEAVAGASYGIFHVTGTRHMPRRDFTDLGEFEAPLLDDIAAMLLEQVG